MERCTRRSHGGVVLITGAGQAGLLWFGRKCSLIENLPTTRYPPLHPCSQLSGWYPHLRDEENEAREVPSIGQGLTVKEKSKEPWSPKPVLAVFQNSSDHMQASHHHHRNALENSPALGGCSLAVPRLGGLSVVSLQWARGWCLLLHCLDYRLARVPGIPEVLPSGLLNLLLLHWVSKSM